MNRGPRNLASEVNDHCRARIADFCAAFFDAGIRVGDVWRVGSVRNEPGKSLVIHLEGQRAGQFYENNKGDASGAKSPIDLYMHRFGVDFKEALAQLIRWLKGLGVNIQGYADGGHGGKGPLRGPVRAKSDEIRAKENAPRDIPVNWVPVKEGGRAWVYLVEERGIMPAVLLDARIGEGRFWFPDLQGKADGIAFPAYDATGHTLLAVKYLSVDRFFLKGPLAGKPESALAEAGKDGAGGHVAHKLVACNKGVQYHLLGMWLVDPKDDRPLVIAEGEVDWLSWLSAGMKAVSVPFGAKADTEDPVTGQMKTNKGNAWIDNDWDFLAEQGELYVAMDNDDTGRAAADTLVRRLGVERSLVVRFTEEGDDANDVFLRDPEELLRCYDRAESIDPEELRRSNDFRAEIFEAFFPSDGEEPGCPTPFNMPFRFREGETTVWTGYNKHGKTICQTFTMVHLAAMGQPVCIASLEIPAAKTLQNVMRMAIGRAKPVKVVGNEEEPDLDLFDRAMTWMDERFFIYDKVGSVDIDNVIDVFRYAARRYGVKQFVLDSLMKLSVDEEDAEAIKGLMNKVTTFAREYRAHVHFVAHSKKSTDKRPEEKYAPRKHDVKGSVSITNIPDNIIIIWRNKSKERKLEELRIAYYAADQKGDIENRDKIGREADAVVKLPDAQWIVEGQRFGTGAEPLKYLWFDVKGSWQYFDSPEALEEGAVVYINK